MCTSLVECYFKQHMYSEMQSNISLCSYHMQPNTLIDYCTTQNFRGRKYWPIWQIARDSPKFSCPNLSFLKAEVLYIYVKGFGWEKFHTLLS